MKKPAFMLILIAMASLFVLSGVKVFAASSTVKAASVTRRIGFR